jgi:hypothetical protein
MFARFICINFELCCHDISSTFGKKYTASKSLKPK